MTQSSAGQQRIRDLIKDIRFAMLATTESTAPSTSEPKVQTPRDADAR